MKLNKYVLFMIMILVFAVLIAFLQQGEKRKREPFISKIREGYRISMRGTRNIVHDIYKYGYMQTSKLLRSY